MNQIDHYRANSPETPIPCEAGVESVDLGALYGLQMLAAGKEIDYQGATDVEFNAFGDANGAFKEVEVRGGSFVTVGAL